MGKTQGGAESRREGGREGGGEDGHAEDRRREVGWFSGIQFSSPCIDARRQW